MVNSLVGGHGLDLDVQAVPAGADHEYGVEVGLEREVRRGHFWLVPVQGLPSDELLDVSTPSREDGPWYGVTRLSGTDEPLSMLTGDIATDVVTVTPAQLFDVACQYR